MKKNSIESSDLIDEIILEEILDIEEDIDETITNPLLDIGTIVSIDEDAESKKPKKSGKHKLKYDSIFKGKKNSQPEEDGEWNQSINMNPHSKSFEQINNYDENLRLLYLKEKIYNIIITKTNINIKSNRRKPSKIDFNIYYDLMLKELKSDPYNHGEIFVELSGYFSEHVYNMFELLHIEHRTNIINYLVKKYNINYIDDLDFG